MVYYYTNDAGNTFMSNRELARQLIENLSKYRLGYVVAHLQGINANEAADDMFCAQLLEDYKNSEYKGEFVSLEEAAKMCGIKKYNWFGFIRT